MAFQATTGLGVAAKIISPGNVSAKTVPGYNTIALSLSGTNGPTTFQLNPVIEDAFGNPYTPGVVLTLTSVAAGSIGTLTLTSIAASANGQAVYTGTITGGGSNAFEGDTFIIAGFTNAVNNGEFLVAASTTTTLTLVNASAVAETHAATAAPISEQGTAVYTGTITNGGSNAYVGATFTVAGFTNGVNNGTFIATASSATTLTLENGGAIAETHVATATAQETISPIANQLGAASAYELLAYSGITNSGSSVVVGGKIGSSPTATITGFPPGVLTPPAVIDNTNAAAAQTALASAITYYQGLTPTLSGLSNLSTGGNGSTASTYTAGVYAGASSLTMPTGITLDAQNNPNAVFVFVAGSTINLASGQTVALVNGAQAANVVFVAGSSFTSVATSTVNGNVLAAVSITLGGGTINGRALANTGAVTISTATTATSPLLAPIVGPIANVLTYVEYGFKTLTGNTYLPSGTPTQIVTVSSTGLITAVAKGEAQVETSYPTFNNTIGDIVSPGNIMNGLPINKIYAENRVVVLV
jgi:hypothetical protein